MPRPWTVFIDMTARGKCLGGRGLALFAVLLFCASAWPASVGAAAEWRYCYAGSEQGRRFYVSQPFSTTGSLDAVERQWAVWLGRQAVRYETAGCPRGPDRTAVETAVRSASRYNASLGRSTIELDWQSTP